MQLFFLHTVTFLCRKKKIRSILCICVCFESVFRIQGLNSMLIDRSIKAMEFNAGLLFLAYELMLCLQSSIMQCFRDE